MLNTAFKEICHLLLHTFYLYKFALFQPNTERIYCFSQFFSDIQESLRKLTLLLWAQVITLGMVSGLTATAWFTYKLIYVRRRSLSPQVHSVKGVP